MNARASAPNHKWTTLEGAGIRLHVLRGGSAEERAIAELRYAEQSIAALRELLNPPPGGPVAQIWSVDAIPGHARRSAVLSRTAGVAVVFVAEPDTPAAGAARLLAREMVRRWFPGADALPAMIDGLVEYAMASVGVSEGSAADADGWVRERLSAADDALALPISSAAPTPLQVSHSFVRFLLDDFGVGAVRDYLARCESEHRDQAANAIFHRPLGALQEAWLNRLRMADGHQSPVAVLSKHLGPCIRPHKWRFVEPGLYVLLGGAYGLALPLSMKILIDDVLFSGDTSKLVLFLAVLTAIFVLNALVLLRRTYVVSTLTQDIMIELQHRLFAHVQRLSHSFHGRIKTGDMMARFNRDVEVVHEALFQITGAGFLSIITAFAALVAMFIMDAMLTGLVLVVVPLFVIAYGGLAGRMQRLSFETQERYGETSALLQETLTAFSEVKTLDLEASMTSAYRSRLEALARVTQRLFMTAALFHSSMAMAVSVAQVVIFGVGGYLVMEGDLSLGALLAFLGLMPQLFTPIADLAKTLESMQTAAGSMVRVNELLDEKASVADQPLAGPLAPLERSVQLDGLTFGYDGATPALRDVSVTIAAGRHLAVVGPSGAGKSSMVNMLMRFWDPQQGSVRFDGIDIRERTAASLRGQIGLISQETVLFDTTIRQNIAFARPSASEEDIHDALEAARLLDWVQGLPEGLDTLLGERGVRMSGGQRQRLAIARALIRNPRVLILDEATSALDARTEAEIRETLVAASRGRTTITITHRLALAAAADDVIVLDAGRIVERGTHAELVRSAGLYQAMWEEQTVSASSHPDVRVLDTVLTRGVALFDGLDADSIAEISRKLTLERFAEGDDIVRAGDPGDKLYVLRRGSAEVLLGRDERVVNVLTEGDPFGEVALLEDTPRTATVRALGPTEVLVLSNADFRELLSRDEALRTHVSEIFTQRRHTYTYLDPAD